MTLLAKDGIYIRDFPRKINFTKIPTGGRADLMVRCRKPGIFNVTRDDYGNKVPLFTIKVDGPRVASRRNLKKWTPKYPAYL